MTRKTPIQHKVRSHTRKGRRVQSYLRGKGIRQILMRKRKFRSLEEYRDSLSPREMNNLIHGHLIMWVAEVGGKGGRAVQTEKDLTKEGSIVYDLAERLRFHKSTHRKLTEAEIRKVAKLVEFRVKDVKKALRGGR